MKAKHLIVLTLVALALGSLALWSMRKEVHRTTPAQIGKKLLPDLQNQLNDIQAVVVRTASGTAAVARIDGVWRVPGKRNYPAEFGKIRDLLTKLADLKILQAMRAAPALLKELQLVPPGSDAASQTIVVDLQDKNGKTLASLRVGKTRSRAAANEDMNPYGGLPDGRFVATDAAQIFVIGDALNDLVTDDRNWLDHELFTVTAGDLVAITVTGATNGTARMERPADGGDWMLPDLPPGKTADMSKLNGLASSLGFLRFEDLADPTLTPEQTGLDKPVTVQGRARNGAIYTVRLGKLTENGTYRYVAFNAAFEAPAEPAPSAAGTNEVAAAKARAEEQAKTAADMQKLNERISPWVYLATRYEADALAKGQADLLKDATEEAKKTESTEAP